MEFEAIRPGPARLIRALIDELQIVETINRNLRWDEVRWKISPGELLAAVIIYMFCKRHALYKVEKFFELQDLELLFGRKDLKPEDFTDDSIGRALDRLAESNFEEIFGYIVTMAQQAHEFATNILHADTTSINVYGEYEHPVDPDFPIITYGYSKDHRPDLKQFKYGLVVQKEGVPVFGRTMEGNASDTAWNQELLAKVAKELKEYAQSIFVADCKAVAPENLAVIKRNNLRFISRLPDNYDLCGEIKERAWRENTWQDIGQVSGQKKAASYKIQGFTASLYETEYRLVVVNSSSLDKRKEGAIRRQIAKEKEKVIEANKEMNKQQFACLADAQTAWRKFTKRTWKYHIVKSEVVSEEIPVKHAKAGRPAKQDVPATQKVFKVQCVSLEENPAAIATAYDLARTFVLITNVFTLSGEQILRHYKEQHMVERRFEFLKDPYYVGPVFLKKEERVKALSHILLLTLLLYSLFERRVRRNLKAENVPFHVAGSYRTFTPTGKTVLEPLDEILLVFAVTPAGVQRVLPKNTGGNILRVIRLAGFSPEIYTNPVKPYPRDG